MISQMLILELSFFHLSSDRVIIIMLPTLWFLSSLVSATERQQLHTLAFPSVSAQTTLRASLSGTFLQTLPDLLTPLKGHLLISAQLSSDAVSGPPKGSGTNMTVEAT